MKDRTALIESLKDYAPHIAIDVTWSPEDSPGRWDPQWGDQDDFESLQCDVSASAIVAGKLYAGNGYLGDSWQPYGEPRDWEIDGYFPQLMAEALHDLEKQTPGTVPPAAFRLFA